MTTTFEEGILKNFDEARPDAFWMPDKLRVERESPTKYFGYKWFDGKSIHEVTDWAHIRKFLIQVMKEVREDERNKLVWEVIENSESIHTCQIPNGCACVEYYLQELTNPPQNTT